MAESADVLSADHQQVILPDLAAGCSMADMADPEQLEMCWSDLEQMGIIGAEGRRRVPVTYINSAAAIKAFCGERGGVVCTSSNAAATLRGRGSAASGSCSCPISISAATPPTRWACRSTRWWCGIRTRSGAASMPDAVQARAHHPVEGPLLGAHALHRAADREHPARASRRARDRASRGAVDVVQAADDSGSTEYIITQVKASPAGSVWAVGTEIHLVNRLAQRGAARSHRALARSVRLPVLDDVPRVAEPSAVDARRAGRRRGPQPHRRARRPEALDEGRARPHAVDSIDCRVAPDRVRFA